MSDDMCDVHEHACWHQRCLAIGAPRYLIAFGEAIHTILNPIIASLSLEAALITLNFLDIKNKEPIKQHLCHLHHHILTPMVTLVGFYAIFKQRRPCMRKSTGKTISTYYGMPSGDAMFATLVACALFNQAPFFAFFICLATSFSRIILGYHSIQQVVVGIIFAIILFMMDHLNHAFLIMNWILATTLPLAVFFDPKLDVVEKSDWYSLQVWVIVDASYLVFDLFYCAPEEFCLISNCSNTKKVIITIGSAIGLHVASYIQSSAGFSISLFVKSLFNYKNN